MTLKHKTRYFLYFITYNINSVKFERKQHEFYKIMPTLQEQRPIIENSRKFD